MSSDAFDLFIIGAGSGGVRAARMAGQRGLRVAVAEDAALGGTCVNLGCIPKKLYSFAAHYAESFEEAHGFGWSVPPATFDWETLKANRARELRRLNGIYGQLMESAGVRIIAGRARVLGPNEVGIGDLRYRAERILVATGGWPVPPEVPGGELAISSNEIFDLPVFPRRLVVVGGGYIASEFASIFNGLGAEVTQIYRGEQILRGFDDDVRQFVAAEMAKKGVDIRVGTRVGSLQRGDGRRPRRRSPTARELAADAVLYATGRAPNTQRARTRGDRRRAGHERRRRRRRRLPQQRAERLRGRRRDRPRPAHAGGAGRGDGAGRRPVRRRRAPGRLPAHPDGGVHAPQHRHDRPVRSRCAGPLRAHPRLPHRLQAACATPCPAAPNERS